MSTCSVSIAAGCTVLGIDAAWTAHQPSGVALVQQQVNGWCCLALAPSYSSFQALADGMPVDWTAKAMGHAPEVAALLAASERLAGRPVDLLAIDMPLSTLEIDGRRVADQQVSQEYGSCGCAVHTPTRERPGAMADRVRCELDSMGYPLLTSAAHPGAPGVLEVYPHVALLTLLGADYRLPYKVSRSSKYWPGETLQRRIEALLATYHRIRTVLQEHIADVSLPLPEPGAVTTLASLKVLEDSLDALVCAWMAMEHLQGRSRALGDHSAAIWCPSATRA